MGYTQWRNFTNVVDKAKDFAAEMTSVNIQSNAMSGVRVIEKEHVENNTAVRKILIERGIVPENLPPAEDVKKVERRLKSEDKRALESIDNQKLIS